MNRHLTLLPQDVREPARDVWRALCSILMVLLVVVLWAALVLALASPAPPDGSRQDHWENGE